MFYKLGGGGDGVFFWFGVCWGWGGGWRGGLVGENGFVGLVCWLFG